MIRLSELARLYAEDPVLARAKLAPAVLLWREAPVKLTNELIWQTVPHFQIGGEVHDPAVFALRKHPERPSAVALGITLGRATNNDIALDHASVSRFHAYVQFDASGACSVFDADSSNGTLCDGHDVPRGKPAPLLDGGRIRLGDVTLHFFLPATFEAVWLQPKR